MANTRDTMGEQACLDALIGHTLTEFEDDLVTSIGQYAMYKQTLLQGVNMPNLGSLGNYAFSDCSALASAVLPKVTTVGQYAFQNCVAMQEFNLPYATSIQNYAFSGCSGAKRFKIGLDKSSVASLNNVNAFNGTGRSLIYVPHSLVSNYKSASRWSTIADRIYSINDLGTAPEWTETEITDGWDVIEAHITNGTAASTYKVGQYKTIDLGTEVTVHAQIIGFNKDTIAEGSSTAAITWLIIEILNTTKRMNPALSGTTEGTGTIGGWEKCETRTYLAETIFPLLPEALRGIIKEVTKYTDIYNTSGTKVANSETTDKLWIPSAKEMYGGTSYETSGPTYLSSFPDDSTRIKKKGTSANNWWLRSAFNASTFRSVGSYGGVTSNNANNPNGVVFGFCT